MGSSVNFPPITLQQQGTTDTLVGQTGTLGSTAIYTAQVTGMYEINVQVHIVSTNNAGTLSVVFAVPSIGTVLTLAPNIATGKDAISTGLTAWLAKGDQVTAVATATGLTATTYNILVNVGQLL
jgi:hypothetical protein